MRHLSVIGLLLVVAVICPTVLAEDKASPAVKRILDKAVGKVRTNRAEFDKANMKPLDEARAELQELSTKLIKDGKTQEAGDVLKQVGTLEADVMRQANAPPSVAGAGGPQKPLLERMAGKWRRGGNNDVFVFSPDGVVQTSRGSRGKLRLVSPHVAEAELDGWRVQLLMAHEDVACALEWNTRGEQTQGFVLERMK